MEWKVFFELIPIMAALSYKFEIVAVCNIDVPNTTKDDSSTSAR